MISARHTDCIYKISGVDGHIIWRLGGDESSFVLDGFNFSKQHDARFIEQNATTTVISFLDNAVGGKHNATASHSTAYLVALETTIQPMVARVVRRWNRPDGNLTRARGNVQLLPGGNTFTAWSGNAYITEHTFDGDLLLEARFASTDRTSTTSRPIRANLRHSKLKPMVLRQRRPRLCATSAGMEPPRSIRGISIVTTARQSLSVVYEEAALRRCFRPQGSIRRYTLKQFRRLEKC
jgi:hypothetical protein